MTKETDKLGRARRKTCGAAGPKPLPDKVKTAKAGAFDMSAPPHLEAHGKAWWAWAVASLDKMGILDAADRKHIELCAETVDDYKNGLDDVRALGRILAMETREGTVYRRNPATVTVEKSRMALRSFYSDLGLTPSARSKFGGGEPEVDPFAELLEASRRGN